MIAFVGSQVTARLDRVASEVRKTLKNADPDAVHDLRVAIRRLVQCLRIFESQLPKKASKKIRRQLRDVLQAAGRLRDYDIALELLLKCGYPRSGAASRRLLRERKQRESLLRERLRRLARRDFLRRWQSQLNLEVTT